MSTGFDFAVIGAGIAGASVAAELSQQASVLLLEQENTPGYHSTGRSAAMYIPSYGPPLIQALTRASGSFFDQPPEEFCSTPLLQPRAEMLIARTDQLTSVESFMNDVSDSAIRQIDSAEVLRQCPLLKQEYAAAGILDTSGSDIDVHTLHQGYLALFKRYKGVLVTNSEVVTLAHKANNWNITTTAGDYTAATVVNAAGAWADKVGQLAHAEPINLTPKRRTAMIIDLPDQSDFSAMPLVADIDEAFYIKPDAGRLLISPANADPVAPCDVQPEELDIAVCIDEVEKAFDIKVKTIVRKWAGLRSFVSDNSPVAGYSTRADNFFWLAGQGGYGIQTSPALSRYAAALLLNESVPEDIQQQGLNATSLAVQRLQPVE